MKPTRILSAMVMVAGFALTGCDGPPPKTFTSPGGNFRVDMPGDPKVSQRETPSALGSLTLHSATVEDRGKVAYMVMYSDCPSGTATKDNVDVMLDQGSGGFISGAKFQETGRQTISLDGHPGRELTFQIPGAKPGRGKARFFMVGDRLYQVVIAGPESRTSSERCDQFLKSFQLLEKKPSVTGGGA